MKRWDEILKEEPSRAASSATEARVFAEMTRSANSGRRWWLQLAGVSVALAAVFGGFQLVRRENAGSLGSEGEHNFVELAEDEHLDLENIEDLDVIELLEELEQWQSG